MKIKNAALLITLLQSTIAFSQNPVSPIQPQIDVTRDQIQRLVNQLNQSRSNATYKNADYLEKSRQLLQKIEDTLVTFEMELKANVLSPLEKNISEYNNVVNSNQYTPDQNAELRRSLLAAIQTDVKKAESNYHASILKLYQIMGPLPIEQKITYKYKYRDYDVYQGKWSYPGSESHQYSRSLTAGTSSLEGLLSDFYDLREINIAQGWIAPFVANGCYSTSCLALSHHDLESYFNSVRRLLDKDLVIQLQDGTQVTLAGYINREKKAGLSMIRFDLTFMALGWRSDSPNMNLPFDITAEELPSAIQKRKLEIKVEYTDLLSKRAGLLSQLENLFSQKKPVSQYEFSGYVDSPKYSEMDKRRELARGLITQICQLSPSGFDLDYRAHCVTLAETTAIVRKMNKVGKANREYRKNVLLGNESL